MGARVRHCTAGWEVGQAWRGWRCWPLGCPALTPGIGEDRGNPACTCPPARPIPHPPNCPPDDGGDGLAEEVAGVEDEAVASQADHEVDVAMELGGTGRGVGDHPGHVQAALRGGQEGGKREERRRKAGNLSVRGGGHG